MRDRVSKPRVFLSHSSRDKEFINTLAGDLRKCQIEPWLDTEEIRDGRPWLKVIFEDGIPTCDAVILYLTENSLASKMVSKEMDATLVEQLGESGIALLPYVSKSELRGRLRSDIRTLQCREWNEDNYRELLPSVVAEMWRSFMERTVISATAQEKSRRLELELELKKSQERYDANVFTPSEEREFPYIHERLNRSIELRYPIQVRIEPQADIKVGEDVCKYSLLAAIISYVNDGAYYFEQSMLDYKLRDWFTKRPAFEQPGLIAGLPQDLTEPITIELQTFGLVRSTLKEGLRRMEPTCEFTEKVFRFKYWLDYYGHSVGDVFLDCERRITEDLGSVIRGGKK